MELARASRRQQRWLAVALGSCLAATLHAQQTDWAESGRPLPQPDAVQPDLDPRLPDYQPCPVAAGVAITGTAPAILPDLVQRWKTAFAQRNPAIRIDVPPPYGSPQGALNPRLLAFLTGSGDLAFLTRAMSRADRETFTSSRGHAPVIVPVALGSFRHFGFVDPVVVIVNDANPVGQLSNADLRRLFAAHVAGPERPVSWADLGVSAWPGRPVKVVGGADWHRQESARGLALRERLLGNDFLRTDLGAASGTEAEVPDRVAADPGAIGFTGLGHLRIGVRPLSIADSSGNYIAPTFAEVAAARYPLTRTVDLVLATPPGEPLPPGLAEFVRFLLSRDGQSIVREQGIFLPLRAVQVAAARASLGIADGGCPGGSPGPASRRYVTTAPIG
jgi:phosphate transport system substrate-binding protein